MIHLSGDTPRAAIGSHCSWAKDKKQPQLCLTEGSTNKPYDYNCSYNWVLEASQYPSPCSQNWHWNNHKYEMRIGFTLNVIPGPNHCMIPVNAWFIVTEIRPIRTISHYRLTGNSYLSNVVPDIWWSILGFLSTPTDQWNDWILHRQPEASRQRLQPFIRGVSSEQFLIGFNLRPRAARDEPETCLLRCFQQQSDFSTIFVNSFIEATVLYWGLVAKLERFPEFQWLPCLWFANWQPIA